VLKQDVLDVAGQVKPRDLPAQEFHALLGVVTPRARSHYISSKDGDRHGDAIELPLVLSRRKRIKVITIIRRGV